MTTLYVVRHGQSTWNVAGVLQGQASGPELTSLGFAQARAAADELAALRVDALYSSDQLRAVQTATVLGDRLGVAVQLEPRLRERSYGSLEGHPSARAVELAGTVDWLDPHARPGDGESLRDVHARVGAVVTRCVEQYPDGTVVLVSHGDTIQVLAGWVAGRGPHDLPWMDVANGSVTVFDVPHEPSGSTP